MNSTLDPDVDARVLRIIQEGMGLGGDVDYTSVARKAKVQNRTLKSAGEHTTVGTLRSVGDALGLDLVISWERRS